MTKKGGELCEVLHCAPARPGAGDAAHKTSDHGAHRADAVRSIAQRCGAKAVRFAPPSLHRSPRARMRTKQHFSRHGGWWEGGREEGREERKERGRNERAGGEASRKRGRDGGRDGEKDGGMEDNGRKARS